MKQAKFIIDHISEGPLHSNFKKARCYKALTSFFPATIKDGIKFMYNKNNTLFIAFKHQGYWMEFNNYLRKHQKEYKQNYIKKTLNSLAKLDPTCKCVLAESIKSFYMDSLLDEKTFENTLPNYEERSKAEFKNNTNDKKLHKLFEQIREIICSQKP